ncbi:MAG: flagellin [Planctomycetes bacterium]|nr:flagellin [Planctomycetota bacterium]
MSRINTNVPSLIGNRVLTANKESLNLALERLSTGLRINRGKDDPAGLIASQNLRAEKSSLGAAISNAERADQVVNIAEGGLEEVASLLNEVQGLITQTANTAGLSKEEKTANQLQIDSILQTIDRIASATSFQGLKLLNGNFDYNTTGVSAAVVGSFKVNGAKLGFGESRQVDVLVTKSAQVGGFFLSFGANNLNLGGAGASDGATSSFVIEVGGLKGTRELSFSSGTSLNAIRDAINSFSAVTGVKARVSGTTGVRLFTDAYGSDQFVSVKVSSTGSIDTGNLGIYNLQTGDADSVNTTRLSTFSNAINRVSDFGQDIQATINGIRATTRGTVARISTDFLDVQVDLKYDTSGGAGANAAKLGSVNAFTITGGGADFQMASKVDIAGRVSLGVQTVAVRDIGRTLINSGSAATAYFLKDVGTGRSLNIVDGDLDAAQQVVDSAVREISSVRGRLGAFQKNTIGATIRSLGISLENTTAAESTIRDTDFAEETAQLTRSQILVSSSTQILGIANQQPQSALQLLG